MFRSWGKFLISDLTDWRIFPKKYKPFFMSPLPSEVGDILFWHGSCWRQCQHKTSCPLCNLKTLWNILMKLGRNVDQYVMTCHIQDWQFWLSYFRRAHPLFYYAPSYSKNSGRALSVTPVRPIRPFICMSVPIRVWAITPKQYEIYLWNFTGACMALRRCVVNKEDNSCLFGFWIICPWLSSI